MNLIVCLSTLVKMVPLRLIELWNKINVPVLKQNVCKSFFDSVSNNASNSNIMIIMFINTLVGTIINKWRSL